MEPDSLATARRPAGAAKHALTVVEVVLAVSAVALDVFLPTLDLVLLVVVSLRLRGEGWTSLGVRRPARPGRMVLEVAVLTAVWR